MNQSNKRNVNRYIFLYVLGIGIVLFNGIMIAHHEAWRDEAQSWLIARDASFFKIFELTSVEGHPFLYFIMLMPFAKLGFPYVTANILSLLLMIGAMFLFIQKVKLNFAVKLLALFSPMFIFYYPVFARSYSLLAFVMICLMAIYHKRDDYPVVYGVLLAILAQTHVIILGFVITLSVKWLIETLYDSIKGRGLKKNKKDFIGLLIVLFSGFFLLWEFRNIFNTTALDEQDISGEQSGTIYTIVILLIITFVCICVLKRFVKNNIIFDSILILVCSHVWELIVLLIYQGHTWQIITWLYVLVFCICVLCIDEGIKCKKKIVITSLCLFFLSLPAIVSSYKIKPIIWDYEGLYSGSKNVSEYIEKNIDKDKLIIFNDEDHCVSIIPYLKEKELYNVFTGEKASYIDRGKKIRHRLLVDEYNELINRLLDERKEIYLVYSIKSNMIEGIDELLPKYELIYDESDMDIITEKYKIYRIIKK